MTFKTGLTRARVVGANRSVGGLTPYRVQNAYAQAMAAGDPVRLSAGTIKLGLNTAAILGVVEQFAWIDDNTKQPRYASTKPASVSSANGSLEGFNLNDGAVIAFVADDPQQTFLIRSETSIALSNVGGLARVTAAGTNSRDRSLARADIGGTAVSAGNAAFRIVGIPSFVVNASAGTTPQGTFENNDSSPNPWIEVVIQNHFYN